MRSDASEDRSEDERGPERAESTMRHRRRTCTPRPPRRAASTTSADDDNYREALGVLLESYQRDADLTPFGSKMPRFFLRDALVARLLSEAAWKQHPEHADVPIERPIFVTGLPRTGTTALHRLLTADPPHQGLELWLAELPQPRPPRETWAENPVFQRTRRPVHQGAQREPRVHGPALHDRRRGRGVLAAAAPVAAVGVLRDAGAPPDLLAVAGAAGLDQAVSAAPQEPAADRAERPREALGAEEPEPPVRARRAARGLSRRAGHPVPPAGGDDHGVGVLAGPAHHRGLVEHASSASDRRRTRWRRGRAGWSCSMPNGPSTIRPSSATWTTSTSSPTRWHASRGSTATSASSSPTRRGRRWRQMHAESKQGPRAPKHTYSLADYGLTAERSRSASRDCDDHRRGQRSKSRA